MKRLILALLILLLPTMAGCRAEQGSTQVIETEYYSNTSTEDCYLCGGGIENLIPSYWGQNNVAFISLNTFEIIPLIISRYDINGHLMEEYAGTGSLGGGSSGDDGFSANFFKDYGRRFAHGQIDFHNDEILDTDKAASFLCTDCLNEIVESVYGTYYGVGVINLETKELRLLEKRLAGLGLGDYYIFCDLEEQRVDDSLRMKLLVIYSPIWNETQ